MGGMDFFEEDEPQAKIEAAFASGEKGLTDPFDTTEEEFDARMAASSPARLKSGIAVTSDSHKGTVFKDCSIRPAK